MSASLILKYAIELVAVLLLALGIKGLSKVRSARGANQLAAVAMALAVLGLLINYAGDGGIAVTAWIWIIAGTLAGGILGAITAQRVPMTSMPETVALFNGCGGMSSAGALGVALFPEAGGTIQWCRSSSRFCRSDHLHYSIVAMAKLQGWLTPPGCRAAAHAVNIALRFHSWQQSS